MSAVKTLECPNCGAPVYRGMLKCEYCGQGLSFVDLHTESKTPDWLKEPASQKATVQIQREPIREKPKGSGLGVLILLLLIITATAYSQGWLKLSGPSSYSAIPAPTGLMNVQAPIRFSVTCQNESFHAPWANYTVAVSNPASHVIYEKYSPLFSTSTLVYSSGTVLTVTINQAPLDSMGPQVESFNTTLPKMDGAQVMELVRAGIQPVFSVGRC